MPVTPRCRSLAQSAAVTLLVVGALLSSSCDRSKGSSESTEQTSGTTELEPVPSDQSRSGTTDRELYRIEVEPRPNPIPFQQLFELRVRIYRGDEPETPAEEARIDDLRAVMPAHDHGMKTAPRITRTAPGEFRVEGMRFHMQGPDEDGRWVLQLVVHGSAGVDRASFDFQCCKPR